MNSLTGIDTTKVYDEFIISDEQVKNLKCKQWFIHVDLVNWLEEELNRLAEWNVIKILYRQIYHYDFNHVKCLEIYYNNDFDDQMETFSFTAQYKMLWKGEMIYYRRTDPERQLHKRVNVQLKSNSLQESLIKSYKIKVNWTIEHSLKVYEFKSDLNDDQKLKLDKIFKVNNQTFRPIFISNEFLFLKVTEPPTTMRTEVLLPYHGQYLADLNIEDILALELANKDHRLPFYDRDLDHDIQTHFQTRFPTLSKNIQIQNYVANEFTNSKILKYFIYKYRHCLTEVIIPNQMLSRTNISVIEYENKNLRFTILQNNNLRMDIIAPGNITICSLTYGASEFALTGHPDETAQSATTYIHLNHKMNYNLGDWRFTEIQLQFLSSSSENFYFEIIVRTNDTPASLSVLIHKLLEQIEKNKTFKHITVRLTALNEHISNSILNIFLKTSREFDIEFKNITFHLPSLLKWFNKVEKITSVGFINCRILFNKSCSKIHKITRMQNINIWLERKFVLKFRNMNIDGLLPIRFCTIEFNNCNINPSVWSALSSTTFDGACFKNMRVELCRIASWKLLSLEFQNCEMEPNDTFKSGRTFCTHLQFTEMCLTPKLIDNLKYFDIVKSIVFRDCEITNENILKIWKYKRDQKLIITGTHQINESFYFELIAMLYENQLDQLQLQFKNRIYFPFENFIEIDWSETPCHYIEWNQLQIGIVVVNDTTLKLEYFKDGTLFDVFFKQNEWHDSEICEVQYY